MECRFDEAIATLKEGEPVIFDTDTVAGIGVAVEFAKGLEPLAQAKGRDAEKPVAWLVGDVSSLNIYGKDVPEYARILAESFWPGGLTIVVEASSRVPQGFLMQSQTIGLRMPDCPRTIDLIGSVGCPIAATSANFAGVRPPASITDVDPSFAPGVLRLEPSQEPKHSGDAPSTVIDCTQSAPRLLREGTIPFSVIENAIAGKQ